MRRLRLFLTTVLSSLVLCSLGLHDARADVYAWEDEGGRLTFSDVPPPPGARVLETVRESQARDAAPAAPASAAGTAQESEVRYLSERVRQLERQADLAATAAASVERYEPLSPPPLDVRCNGKWADCWWWRNQPFYGPSLYSPGFGAVIVPSYGFRGSHQFPGMRRFPRGAGHRR